MPNSRDVQDQDEKDQTQSGASNEDTSADEIEDGQQDQNDGETKGAVGEDGTDGGADKKVHTEEKAKNSQSRPVYSMPVAKAQEEKQKAVEKAKEEARRAYEEEVKRIREEYEEKILKNNPSATDDELERIADEQGLDPKSLKRIAEALTKKIKSTIPDMSKYENLAKEAEISALKNKVRQEITEKVAPLILNDYPQASPEHIAQVQERIAELAFTSEYNTYRLEDIYKVNKDTFEYKNGYSAEPSGSRGPEYKDFSHMTDEEEIQMAKRSPEMYKKYLKWQDSQGSKYLN